MMLNSRQVDEILKINIKKTALHLNGDSHGVTI